MQEGDRFKLVAPAAPAAASVATEPLVTSQPHAAANWEPQLSPQQQQQQLQQLIYQEQVQRQQQPQQQQQAVATPQTIAAWQRLAAEAQDASAALGNEGTITTAGLAEAAARATDPQLSGGPAAAGADQFHSIMAAIIPRPGAPFLHPAQHLQLHEVVPQTG